MAGKHLLDVFNADFRLRAFYAERKRLALRPILAGEGDDRLAVAPDVAVAQSGPFVRSL